MTCEGSVSEETLCSLSLGPGREWRDVAAERRSLTAGMSFHRDDKTARHVFSGSYPLLNTRQNRFKTNSERGPSPGDGGECGP